MPDTVFLRSRRGAFGRDGHPALKCNPDGRIQANTFGKAKQWEEWTLHHVGTEKDGIILIALQSWTGKYLSAKPKDGKVVADADEIGSWERWEVHNTNDFFVSLKSHFGGYLYCNDFFDCGRSVKADGKEVKEWEEWAILSDQKALTGNGNAARQAILGTVVALGSVATLGALAIPVLGFGAGGVAAGSAAAAIQSAVYGGATCGVFSVLQSAGATLAWVPIAAGGAATTAAAAKLRKQEQPVSVDTSDSIH